MTRTYSDMIDMLTFEERFNYLKLDGSVGRGTFGYDRWLNQSFYGSREWYRVRDEVIVRDNGCDLGIEGFDIHLSPLVHHINPITPADIIDGNEAIVDPRYLITTCHTTHNALHFGTNIGLPKIAIEREPNDTNLW